MVATEFLSDDFSFDEGKFEKLDNLIIIEYQSTSRLLSDINGRKSSYRRDSRLDESGFIDEDTSFSVRKPPDYQDLHP